MAKGDKTGPEGKGSKTGRGLGYCSGSKEPGYKSDEPRQGLRRGLKDGKGSRRGFGNGLGKVEDFGIGLRIGRK